MKPLSTGQQVLVGLGLAMLMLLTRGQHATAIGFLPDASWAVFFLVGVYLRPAWALPAFMAGAFLLDLVAVTWVGVSGFCISPAYVFLVPAHAALWAAGRWYAGHHSFRVATLLPLAAAVFGAAVAAELLASGSFYLFSGRFEDLSLAELISRLLRYFPSSLEALAFYTGIAALVHVGFVLTREIGKPRRTPE